MEVAFAEKGFEVGAGDRQGGHSVRFSFAHHGAVAEGCQGSGRPLVSRLAALHQHEDSTY